MRRGAAYCQLHSTRSPDFVPRKRSGETRQIVPSPASHHRPLATAVLTTELEVQRALGEHWGAPLVP